MAIHLDDNERAMLRAYKEEDPRGDNWIMPHVLDVSKHGADVVGESPTGRVAVARRLAQRKLLAGEPNARGRMRGYYITDKGLETVK